MAGDPHGSPAILLSSLREIAVLGRANAVWLIPFQVVCYQLFSIVWLKQVRLLVDSGAKMRYAVC